ACPGQFADPRRERQHGGRLAVRRRGARVHGRAHARPDRGGGGVVPRARRRDAGGEVLRPAGEDAAARLHRKGRDAPAAAGEAVVGAVSLFDHALGAVPFVGRNFEPGDDWVPVLFMSRSGTVTVVTIVGAGGSSEVAESVRETAAGSSDVAVGFMQWLLQFTPDS